MASEPRSRRFLPRDPRVAEPYRLTPQIALRVAVLGFLALAVFAVLFLRLWALQVLSGTKYRAEASDNRVRVIQTEAPRGQIIDKNGHVLVDNVPARSLDLWPADMPKAQPARALELQRLSTAVGISVTKILFAISADADDPAAPVVLRRSVHEDLYNYIEQRQLEFPGVEFVQSYLRNYPDKSLAAQLLGYVGPITADELKAAEREGYAPQDEMGQAGVEKSYDRYLRGTDGTAQLTVNSLGQPTSQIEQTKLPIPGDTLRLTINARIQQAAEKGLQAGIQAAHASGGEFADGGAIVAMNPQNGAVLALASYPTYEPSVYVSRDPSKLAPLLGGEVAAKDNFPGLDRAIDAFYPPGSTFKPVTSLAALEQGILTPSTPLDCTPTYSLDGHLFHNWDAYQDQWMSLDQALAESCDTFFYQVGDKFYNLPPSDGPVLQKWAARFGFGKKTGIDIGPEDTGLLPTPNWLCHANGGPPCHGYISRTWVPGFSVLLAIGQGQLEVTPIQMARLYAMIANGGKLVTPHVAQDIETPSEAKGQKPQVLRELATQQPTPAGVNPADLAAVQQGLYDGVHDSYGTSNGVFGQFPVPLAGKTGSAEKEVNVPGYSQPQDLVQSWWCGYGPAGTSTPPKIVVCAVIENGGEGASAAAPAALKVFQAYFRKYGTAVTYHLSD